MVVVHERLAGPDAWRHQAAGEALVRPSASESAERDDASFEPPQRGLLDTVAAMPFAGSLERAALSALLAAASSCRVARGELVFTGGEAAESFYIVVSGKVQLLLPSTDARNGDAGQRMLTVLLPGDVFGQAEALLRRPRELTARACEASELLVIDRVRLETALLRHPSLAVSLLRETSRWLCQLIGDLWRYGQDSAGRRLARYLLEHLGSAGGESARVRWTDRKAAVASQLSITPETLSRELGRLKATSVISEEAGAVVVHDLVRLRAIAADR